MTNCFKVLNMHISAHSSPSDLNKANRGGDYNPFYQPLLLRKYGIRAVLLISIHVATAKMIIVI